MIIIIMTGENFVARIDGLGGTPVASHWPRDQIFCMRLKVLKEVKLSMLVF
jgi:hypothetical protein